MKEITVAGKALPIHFGMKAVDEIAKLEGLEFADTATSTEFLGSISSIVSITVVGLNEGSRKTGSEKRYTADEIWDLFDEDPGLILTISDIFVESIVPLTEKLGGIEKNGKRPTKAKNRK